MREDWTRAKPVIDFDETTIEALIEPCFPCCKVVEIDTVVGGLTNTNLRIRLDGRPGSLLLRFYQRSGDLAHKEMELCRMVEKRVRVPAYLHYAPENPVTGHAFAVIEWVEGSTLQDCVPSLSGEDFSGLGAAIGRSLAAVHGFSYDHFGFFDAELKVGAPMDLSGKGLVDYLRFCLVDGRGGARIGKELTEKVLAFAAREGHRIEDWEARACLVHGDFNPSNILVRKDSNGGWEAAAMIDWEYAFAAAPGFDFGNLLRPPLDQSKDFAAGLEQGYRDGGGMMPADWQRIARITDLFSYADVLHHPETEGAVVEDAKKEIETLLAG
jgi:aminoglycoside phosphotransferase (APT) family kinase protein